MTNLGLRVYGAGAFALGAVNLAFGQLTSWQVVPELLPGQWALPAFLGVLLVLGGIALQVRRSVSIAALLLALVYLLFTFGWAVRVWGFPAILGTWLGLCEMAALIIGAFCCWLLVRGEDTRSRLLMSAARIDFGLCCLVFAAAHFTYPKETAAMVPGWLPPDAFFWAYATGVGHLLAGLALVSGIKALLAARLLTLMFAGFGLLTWLPILLKAPGETGSWGGNAINLALVGAAWGLADTIARFQAKEAAVPTPAGDVSGEMGSPVA